MLVAGARVGGVPGLMSGGGAGASFRVPCLMSRGAGLGLGGPAQ